MLLDYALFSKKKHNIVKNILLKPLDNWNVLIYISSIKTKEAIMSKYVANAGHSSLPVKKPNWLYESFEYGRFPLAEYIAWAFEKSYSYKFWVNGKLVARKALEF